MWLHQTSRVMTKCMKYNWHRHNITLHIHVFTNYQNIVALQQKMQIKHRHLSINMVFLLGESLQCESLCYALFASYAIANMTLLTSRKYITFSYRRYQVTEPRRLPIGIACKKLVKFGRAFLEICSRTDKPTDRHAHKKALLINYRRRSD